MPKEITTTVYTYQELLDMKDSKAIDKAKSWWTEIVFSDNWYESIYEDARQVGLKITEFNLWVQGIPIKGEFIKDADFTAQAIMKDHGKDCDTYKHAVSYWDNVHGINGIERLADSDSENQHYRLELASKEFLKALLHEYYIALRNESEYLESDENVLECMENNEYTFTKDGKRFG